MSHALRATVVLGLCALLVGGVLMSAARAAGVSEAYPPTGAFIEVNGNRLHYMQTGAADGPPVLILHGASGNLHEGRVALEAELGEYRAIWLDRPGLGWSERPGGRWSPQREADLIAAFLQSVEAEGAVVMGHSWGAAIALRLAMDHPDTASGLVLIAPASRAWVGEAALYNRATRWPMIGTVITRLIVPTIGRSRLEDGARSAFAPEPMPENYVEETRLPLILRASNWKANSADMSRVNLHLADQETRYGEIGQPAVIIAGPQDSVVRTDRHAEPTAQTLQNAELVLIEGAGHNPHHHHADEVVAALDRVLAQLP
ncbi:MAG: alpha/beta hydrolase [Pseudomonadota bacterium]